MKIFLIIVAVIAVLIIAICSLSATFTIVYDKKWSTKLSLLFIEKDIELSKIISFILFPEKKAKDISNKKANKKAAPKTSETAEPAFDADEKSKVCESSNQPADSKNEPEKQSKPNPIAKIWQDEGIVGIFTLVSNLLETANSAILTLIRGLHIYSLYVMIIVGGYDAASIGITYGRICEYYYPVKGLILNQMKVDDYDDCIQPDFLAQKTEYQFQLIASISVGLLLKTLIKAAVVFIKNLIQNKKEK